VILFTIPLAGLLLPPAAGGPDRPVTVAEVRAAVAAARQSVTSLRVRYAEYVTDGLAGDPSRRPDEAAYLVDAAFAPDRMLKRLQTVSDEHSPIETRPPVLVATARGELRKVWLNSRVEMVRRVPPGSPELRTFFDTDHYFQALGLWAAAAGGPSPLGLGLPEALDPAKYRVAPGVEVVDGVRCRRVERPGRDRIWVDPARGFAVLRRVWETPAKADRAGSRFVFELTDLREVAPGLWLPWVVQSTRYDWAQGQESAPTMVVTNQMLVGELVVNRTRSDELAAEPLPGTMTIDEATGRRSLRPGGEDLLDRVADDLRAATALRRGPDREAPPTPAAGRWGLAGLAAVLVGVVFGRFALSHTNRRHLSS
jgi:hypothetical protein